MKSMWWAFFLVFVTSPCWAISDPVEAQSESFEQAQRQRIDRERVVEMARQAQVEAACYKRFAVNDCLDQSRVEHANIMADLKRQEQVLNDRDRKLRSARQLQEIENRMSSDQTDQTLIDRKRQGIQTETDRLAAENKRVDDAASSAKDRQQRQSDLQQKRVERAQLGKQREDKARMASQERDRFNTKLKEAAEHKKQLEENSRNREGSRAAPLPAPNL
jgi:hypothetical protein